MDTYYQKTDCTVPQNASEMQNLMLVNIAQRKRRLDMRFLRLKIQVSPAIDSVVIESGFVFEVGIFDAVLFVIDVKNADRGRFFVDDSFVFLDVILIRRVD